MNTKTSSPDAGCKSYGFVWRRVAGSRWYAVNFDSDTDGVAGAIEKMRAHIEKKLKAPLDSIIVDHYFHEHVPFVEAGVTMHRTDPVSLVGMQHPFHIEFANKVYAPGVPVERW